METKPEYKIVGTQTPWGKAQYRYKYARGVTFYGTAGHGGFKVSPSMLKKMPRKLQNPTGWYEEDCEWCKVALAFPELFPQSKRDAAKSTWEKWFNDNGTYKRFL
jgi:hypothetical protein